MRVLLTTHAYPPRSNGGAENYCRRLAQRLIDRGHSVRVLAAAVGRPQRIVEEMIDGVPCTVVEKPLDPREQVFAQNDLQAELAFDRIIGEFRPEIVHVNHLGHLSLNLPIRARTHGAAVVATLHDHWLHCPTSHLLQFGHALCKGPSLLRCARCTRWSYTRIPATPPRVSLLRRYLLAAVRRVSAVWEWPRAMQRFVVRRRRVALSVAAIDRVISPSRHLLEFSCRWGIKPEKLVFLPHGVPEEVFVRLSTQCRDDRAGVLGERDRRLIRFGFIGSFNAVKGIEVLVEAFDGLHGVELRLYGRDSENRLAKFGHILRQGHVRHCGFLEEHRKLEALAALDCLIVPSVCYENSPLVIQEAFAAGVPVLASNIGGMAEMVRPNAGGWQFAVGDASDLRRKVEMLRDQPKLIEEARRSIPAVPTLNDHVKQLEKIYAEARGGNKAGHRPGRQFADAQTNSMPDRFRVA